MLCRQLPWPPNAGGRIRDWTNIKALAQVARVSVLAVESASAHPPPTMRNLSHWTDLDRLHVIQDCLFDSSIAPLGPRWWENDLGFHSDRLWNPFRHQALATFVTNAAPDVCLVEDVSLWRYVEAFERRCPIIIDAHNVQSDLEIELAASFTDSVVDQQRHLIAARNIREVECRLSDHKWLACSIREKERLVQLSIPPENVAVVHNAVDTAHYRVDAPRSRSIESLSAFKHIILFCGVLNYRPNVVAARRLATSIMPRLKAFLPDTALLIAGKSANSEVIGLANNDESIFLSGEVADIRSLMQAASLLCVPLEYGGGTRFKIIEAFASGLPVISSSKGFEGLYAEPEVHLLAAESDDEFCRAAMMLLHDDSLRSGLQAKALLLAETDYSTDVSEAQLLRAIRDWGLCQ